MSRSVRAAAVTVVDSGVINLSPNPDFTGLYINWLTGDWCSSSGGPCNVRRWIRLQPVQLDADVLLAVGRQRQLRFGRHLVPGPDVGRLDRSFVDVRHQQFGELPGWQHDWVPRVLVHQREHDPVNYGYAKFTTTAGTGYPATLVEYWYDNSGAAINIP